MTRRRWLSLWKLGVVLSVVLGWWVLSVAGQETEATVSAYGFELSCSAGVSEGSTLACTLSNTTDEEAEWPVVGVLHLSSDAGRALVVGSPTDVAFGTLADSPSIEQDVWWIGDVLVGYSRFDWDGKAAASSETDTADSRTVNITVTDDTAWEPAEAFYVALAPNGSRGVGFLYDNRAKVTIAESDSKSTDATLSELVVSAGGATVLSPVPASNEVGVSYEVTELTVTPTASYKPSSIDVAVAGSSESLSVDNGQESQAIALRVGATVVTVTVTAENGTAAQDYVVTVTRADSAAGASVTVRQGPFSLVCPGFVPVGGTLVCTLTNTSAATAEWPVVAFLHSSQDSARALIAEDPLIPEASSAYSRDIRLKNPQVPSVENYNFGYGELFSGGSRRVRTTYGYEKFDWDGEAASAQARSVSVEAISDALEDEEVFYAALADSGYTGLRDLVDNKVPIRLGILVVGTAAARHEALRVSWARSVGGWTVTRYDLRFIPTDTPVSDKAVDTNWDERSPIWSTGGGPLIYTLTGLANETSYDLQIREAGSDGDYGWSDTFTGTPMVLNRAPSFPSDAVAYPVDENTAAGRAVGVPVVAADPEGDTLTYSLLGGGDVLAINPATGQLLTTATPLNHEMQDSHRVTVEVSDGKDSNDEPDAEIDASVDVVVTVVDVDEAPVVSGPQSIDFVENGLDLLVGSYSAADPDGKAVNLSLAGDDASKFELSSGALRFRASPDFEVRADLDRDNVYEATVRADDGTMTGDRNVTVTVGDVDEAPVVSGPQSIEFVENGLDLLVGSYSAADPDGKAVNLSLVGDDASKFELSSGALRFRASPDFEVRADLDGDNVYEATVRSDDGTMTGDLDATVTVINVNEDGSLVLSSDQPRVDVSLRAELSDLDEVVSTVWVWERALSSGGPWSVITGETSNSYMPVLADRAQYLRVTATYEDGFGPDNTEARAASLPVRLNPDTNSAPMFEDGTLTLSVAEDASISDPLGAAVRATDVEDTALTYTLAGGGGSFSIDRSTGQIRVAAALNHETTSSYSVTVTAADSLGVTAQKQVQVTVDDVNEAPDAVDDVDVSTLEDTAVLVRVLANDSDPDDGDFLTATLTTDPPRGTAAVQPGGGMLYTPGDDYFGVDNFTYRVTDSSGLFDEAEARITVHAVNDAPQFARTSYGRSIPAGAPAGTNVGAPVIASDVDHDATSLSYSLAGADAQSFDIDPATAQITVAQDADLDPGVQAEHTFTVQAQDPRNAIGTTDVTVEVTSRPVGGGGGGGGGGGVEEQPARPQLAGFSDVAEGSVHAGSIEALFGAQITVGCSGEPLRFCPDLPVTRAQMATFLTRALGLSAPDELAGFSDVAEGSVHAGSIEALFGAQITVGCSGEPLRFCPDLPVTRAQMATFLTRALGLSAPDELAGFSDVAEGSVHAGSIEALFGAQITVGCSREPLRFCPDLPVTRAQMATFLTRALALPTPG